MLEDCHSEQVCDRLKQGSRSQQENKTVTAEIMLCLWTALKTDRQLYKTVITMQHQGGIYITEQIANSLQSFLFTAPGPLRQAEDS